MNPPDRKRIVVTLTPAQESDPKQIIAETRKALREQANLTYVVRKAPAGELEYEVEEVGSEVRKAKEHLEAKALEMAAAVLEKEQAKFEAETAATKSLVAGAGLGSSRWMQAIKKTGQLFKILVEQGVKVTIGELVKDSITGDGPSFPFA